MTVSQSYEDDGLEKPDIEEMRRLGRFALPPAPCSHCDCKVCSDCTKSQGILRCMKGRSAAVQ